MYKILSSLAAFVSINVSIIVSIVVSLLPLMAESMEVEEIITIAKRTESQPSQLSASTAIVTSEELRLVSHTHIQEAVSRVAGVNLNRGNGQEYLPAIRSPVLTGAGACGAFVMAEDGIPLRASNFCNINELFEAHSEVAERIEVLLGPGTVMYGSNAIHGVINVVTASVGSPNKLGVDLTENDNQRLKLSVGAEDFSFATSLTHNGGYRDQTGVDQQKVSLKYRYQTDTVSVLTGLSATNLNQETAGYIIGINAYKDPLLARSNPNPEAYRDVRSARLWSRMVYQLAGAELILTPYVRHTKMDFLQHFLPGDPLEQNGQTGAGTQLSYHFSPQPQTKLILGADIEYTDAFLKQSQATTTVGSAFLQETVPQGKHYDYKVNAKVGALFADMQWHTTDSLNLQAGMRYESTHYDYRNQMIAGRTRDDGTSCGFGGCRYSRPPSAKEGFDNWSADFGLIYDLNNHHKLSARFSRAYRAPQATELYRLQRDQQTSDLKSENISALELSLRGSKNPLIYKLALYHMEKENHIYRDSDFFNLSDGATKHQGLELQLKWQFSAQLEFSFSASHALHRYRHSQNINGIEIRGNHIDSAPRYFANAQILWRYLDQTQFELEWQIMGDYFLDPENLHSYPGHNIFNLRAAHRLSEQFKLYVRVLNLADSAYADRADYTGFSGYRYFPGQPRTLNMGVEWQW